jgi:hypothetical protein
MVIQNTKLNSVNCPGKANSDLGCDAGDIPQQVPTFPVPSDLSPQVMSITELADRCMNEINKYRHGEPSNDQYGIELFRRALTQRDPLAWEIVQQCFSEMMLNWMRNHPMRKAASRIDSEENYVAQAFTRFWQATIGNQEIEFRALAAVLRYLRASLNGTVLDTLRAYSRSRVIPLPEPGSPGEPLVEDQDEKRELWEVIQGLIPNEREQRVAYLIFHCGLKPREIVHFCSEEFSEVQEIYRLRRNIVDRLLRNADYIRWRLNQQFQ